MPWQGPACFVLLVVISSFSTSSSFVSFFSARPQSVQIQFGIEASEPGHGVDFDGGRARPVGRIWMHGPVTVQLLRTSYSTVQYRRFEQGSSQRVPSFLPPHPPPSSVAPGSSPLWFFRVHGRRYQTGSWEPSRAVLGSRSKRGVVCSPSCPELGRGQERISEGASLPPRRDNVMWTLWWYRRGNVCVCV